MIKELDYIEADMNYNDGILYRITSNNECLELENMLNDGKKLV
ncbi:hypothetical protein [Clostridium beijerinckii]|nr:hypothetical protein [Clostridium beijerinckii]NRY61843.1 hypothetical protein [Clostridium beijerinckii]